MTKWNLLIPIIGNETGPLNVSIFEITAQAVANESLLKNIQLNATSKKVMSI
jgi:hypothetical protein